MNSAMVFSGLSNKELASNIARHLGIKHGNVEIGRFKNDEARVFVNEKKITENAIVVQSLSYPVDQHIVEFGLLCDALYRMGVQNLTAVVPWLAYSKQDKVFRPGEPLSVKVIAKMLQVVPVKRMYTFDLHNLAILGFFDIPVVSLTARELFIEHFQKKVTDKTVVVAPDAGAIKSSTAFAGSIGVPVAYMDKKRDLVTGNINMIGISREVKDADVIIMDDMIVTGSTIVETAKYLKEKGVKSISVGATHHLYVEGAQEKIIASGVDEVVVTDTIELKNKLPNLIVLSVASVIAKVFGED